MSPAVLSSRRSLAPSDGRSERPETSWASSLISLVMVGALSACAAHVDDPGAEQPTGAGGSPMTATTAAGGASAGGSTGSAAGSSGSTPVWPQQTEWVRTFRGGNVFRVATDDHDGSVVATGFAYGPIDFGDGVIHPGAGPGTQGTFVVKFAADGTLIWGMTYFGGDDHPSLALDAGGDVYVGGEFDRTIDLGGGLELSAPPHTEANAYWLRISRDDGHVVAARDWTDDPAGYSVVEGVLTDPSGDTFVLRVATRASYLDRLDPSGGTVWSSTVATGDRSASSVAALPTGGFLVAGVSDEDDSVFLWTVDAAGHALTTQHLAVGGPGVGPIVVSGPDGLILVTPYDGASRLGAWHVNGGEGVVAARLDASATIGAVTWLAQYAYGISAHPLDDGSWLVGMPADFYATPSGHAHAGLREQWRGVLDELGPSGQLTATKAYSGGVDGGVSLYGVSSYGGTLVAGGGLRGTVDFGSGYVVQAPSPWTAFVMSAVR